MFMWFEMLKGVNKIYTMRILQNSGMQGTNVVIQIINVNPSDVSSNTIKLTQSDSDLEFTYSSKRSIIDIDVNPDISYNLQIFTTYNPVQSSSLNVRNQNGWEYSSDVFKFRVGSYINPVGIFNGRFAFDAQPTFINGISRSIPYPWLGTSVMLSENVSSTRTTSKHLNISDVSYNLILYNPKPDNTFVAPILSQQISNLFKDFYKLSFHVANHVSPGSPFAYTRSTGSIEYQIKFSSENISIFETNPIVSTDTSWNKFEVFFYLPYSYQNATFTIQRNKNELNNLFLSDISMVGLGQMFQSQVPHTTFTENEWQLPNPNFINTWKGIMPGGTAGNVYCLSSNMSIGFWLYIHDSSANDYSTESKGIFILGKTESSGHPSVYIKENRLNIDDNGRSHIQSPILTSDIKVPIYFNISYDQKSVYLYKNGGFDCSFTSSDYITEAGQEDLIFIGTPSIKTLGYLMNTVKIYNFPLIESQISDNYNRLSAKYSQIGNFYDLSGHYYSVDLSNNNNNKTKVDISFNLNNGKTLAKKINLNSELADVSFNFSSSSSSFTLALWGKDMTGSITFKNQNNGSILSLNCDSTQITPSINTSLPLPLSSNQLQHFSWTFDVSGESKSYLNGYIYDISLNAIIRTTNIFADCSMISFNSTSSNIGELHVFNKTLSPTEVLTNYYNFYSVYSTYHYISGFYRVTINSPDNMTPNDVSYNYNMTSGNMPAGQSYIDISMSPLDLNIFNKNEGSFRFTLTEYDIFSEVQGQGNPYISVRDKTNQTISYETDISENTTMEVRLHNAPNDNNNTLYAFTILGSVDYNDISGDMSGHISITTPVTISMKQDYKTEGAETLIFTIASLGLSAQLNVLDTTINMLNTKSDNFYWKSENDFFVISLIFPEGDEYNYITDFPYSIIRGEDLAERVYNKTSSVFHRDSNNTRQVDISFNVTLATESQYFTLKLDGYESKVDVVLNDILRPFFRINRTSIDEGENITVKLITPIRWENNTTVPFIINGIGINSDDVSCDDVMFSQSGMSGYFVVQDASASLIFKINPNNSYSEGREILNFCLSDVLYNDISASVFIIDTSTPVSCRWNITDMFNITITQINEGETFKVTLITSGIADTTDISYTITGVRPEEIS